MVVTRNPAHVVVHGRLDGNRLPRHLNASKNPGRLGDTGQALVNHFGAEVLQMKLDVVMLGTDAAPFADLHRHRPAHDVA